MSAVEVGVVVKPHGVRGAVKVHLHNAQSTALARCQEVILAGPAAGDGERRVRAQLTGATTDAVVLALGGIETREAAEALRGARVLVERDCLEPCEEEEYYVADLVGCLVEDAESGALLGTIHDVLAAGAADVLVIRDRAGTGERMIPLAEDWVVEVDLGGRRIRVRGADQFEPTPI